MKHRATAPRGAMTQAMSTALVANAPKALRIGVLVGTRLVAERVFRGDVRVSIGRTERATLAVDDPSVPDHLELFTVRGDDRALSMDPRVGGRVSDGARTLELPALRGDSPWRAIDAQWRGRLSVGDATVLFQFVVAPPDAPRAQLPVSIRTRPMREMDWTWNACAAAFLAVAVAGSAWAEYVYDPVVDEEVADIRRMVRLMAEPAAPDHEPDAPERAQGAATAPSPADRTASREAPRSTRDRTGHPAPQRDPSRDAADAAAAAERAARAAMGALERTTFSALTGALEHGNGTARDQLALGATQQATIEDLQRTNGVSTAARTGIGQRTATDPSGDHGLCGEDCLRARTIQPTTPAITSGDPPRERRVAPLTIPNEEPIDGVGEVDAGAVASRIRGQLGGIRSCYERALRDNPALRGRVEVRFTLGENGRIARTTASGMSEAPEVATCVAQRLRALAYPQPRGGSVDFMFPFVFDHD